MVNLEPMPKDRLPKDLRKFPDLFARELYAYRATSRGPAKVLIQEYENTLRKLSKNETLAFRLHDVVFYLAKAAANGIVGNIAYAALDKLVGALRTRTQEIGSKKIEFRTVISRKTYNKLRRERHPGQNSLSAIPAKLDEKLHTEYRLMVSLTKATGSKRKRSSKVSA